MRRSRKITSKKFSIGYVYARYNNWYIRIADWSKSTGLIALKSNQLQAIKILDYYVQLYYNEGIAGLLRTTLKPGVAPATKRISSSLHFAFNEFKNLVYSELTTPNKKNYERAFSFYFKKDCEINYDNLLERVSSINNLNKISINTRRKYMQYLRKFFKEYLIKREYLNKNPFDLLIIPKPTPATKTRFELEEVTKILNYFKLQDKKEYFNAYNVLYLTGMRPIELCRLKKNDLIYIKNELVGLKINGKGGRTREFPVKIFPKLHEILLDQNNLTPDQIKLFKWNNITHLQSNFRKARNLLNIPAEDSNNISRTLYTLRGTREWELERVLLIPHSIVCQLLGHSVQVSNQYYRIDAKYNELETVLSPLLALKT